MILLSKITDELIEVLAPHNYTLRQPLDESYTVTQSTRDGLIGTFYELTGDFNGLKSLMVRTGDNNEFAFKL